MHPEIKVLDHGYIRLIECWGTGDAGVIPKSGNTDSPIGGFTDNECGIIEAARQSTQGSFRGWDQDEKLLNHLAKHRHDTPFEFSGMVIEVQAPIFVFREWHRHRTQSYNEMSARYSPLPNTNYIPTVKRCLIRSKNKQASGVAGAECSAYDAEEFIKDVSDIYDTLEIEYQEALQRGIPKELARIILPFGRYSRMRASANLRNWIGFCKLRNHPDAQWEIRQYAEVVTRLLREQFPHTMQTVEI